MRVSTSKQSLGIDAQHTIINNYIQTTDEVIHTFIEKESGRNNNRVELNKAIQMCKDKNAILLIAKLDRLSRNVKFIADLMESNLDFVACDIPIVDKFTIHLYAALAEMEVTKIKTRTKDSLAEIKNNIDKNGYHISKAGKKITKLGNGNTITDDTRLLALKGIKEKRFSNTNNIKAKALASSLRSAGKTYNDIANTLNENGFKSSRGGIFYPTSVCNLFK